MCVEKLVCKEKVTCFVSGTAGEILFSGIGFISQPVEFIAILLKTSGTYTIEIGEHTITKQGSGTPEFCVLKNLNLISPNIYTLKYTSTEVLSIHELNFATICLCDLNEC